MMKKTIFLLALLLNSVFASAEEIPNDEIWYTASAKLTETTGLYNYDNYDALLTNAFNTSISSHTFSDGKGVIKFNGNVTSIGGYAFRGCSGLTSVTIPNSVTSIGREAFSGCVGLTSITIPNSVTSIGGDAFKGCNTTDVNVNIVDFANHNIIPDHISSQSFNYYYQGKKLVSDITLPDNIVSIGTRALYKTESITSVTIPNSVTSIGWGAFCGCSGLTSVTIGNSVTSIGEWAFYYCRSLTSITIPNSVTSIGDYAFKGCNTTDVNVNIVDFANHNIIPDHISSQSFNYYYQGKKLVSDITLPDNIVSIGTKALYGNRSITSVTIPNSVTSIGDDAFSYCSSLTSVTIPNSVTSIGKSAFYYCRSLTSITIPNSVTSIGELAFLDCSGLTSVTIGNSVTRIGYDAFFGCNNVKELIYAEGTSKVFRIEITSIESVTIPNSVTSIESYAFKYCSRLTSITIPNSVTSIEKGAFEGCIFVDSEFVNNSSLDEVSNSYWGATICDVIQEDGLCIKNNVAISYRGRPTSITIPNYVTSIGDKAFYYCKSLTSITIPNSVTSIGERAFCYCESLISISTKADIAKSAFEGCTDLRFVQIGNSEDAFQGCKKIETLKFADGTTIIRNLGLTSIKTIHIPSTVTTIEEDAFRNYSNLTSISIPSSVKKIGSNAFYGCSKLDSLVVFWSRPLAVEDIASDDVYDKCTLYTAKGTETMYMVAYVWMKFKNIADHNIGDEGKFLSISDEELDGDLVVKIKSSENGIETEGVKPNAIVKVYSTNGSVVASGQGDCNFQLDKGVYILRIGTQSMKVAVK